MEMRKLVTSSIACLGYELYDFTPSAAAGGTTVHYRPIGRRLTPFTDGSMRPHSGHPLDQDSEEGEVYWDSMEAPFDRTQQVLLEDVGREDAAAEVPVTPASTSRVVKPGGFRSVPTVNR